MIDTNVIVSSMLKHDSIPGKITDLVVSNVIVPLLNEEILDEYFEVLTKNKFNFEINNVRRTIAIIKEKGLLLTREQSLEDFINEDDIVFYEIVMSARNTMDAYLVTGNLKHYPIRNYVVTPRQMLEIIEKTNH